MVCYYRLSLWIGYWNWLYFENEKKKKKNIASADAGFYDRAGAHFVDGKFKVPISSRATLIRLGKIPYRQLRITY
jgi:hypothetical protein